jgi:AmmeMemoRadiSam system protein B
MRLSERSPVVGPVRPPAVAGSFYPADPAALTDLVDRLARMATPSDEAVAVASTGLAGILVPHAGLVYSGRAAAMAWRLAAGAAGATGAVATRPTPAPATGVTPSRPTIVLLGTNHSAGWLDGVGVWDRGAWRTPTGDVAVDEDLATAIVELGPPFVVDREAHLAEHSLEVQLPFLVAMLPGTRIVPLAVGTGTGDLAVFAGRRLGALLAERRAAGSSVSLAISTDMAHYPPATIAAQVTTELAPLILDLEPVRLARREARLVAAELEGLVCGMCGIAPTVVGLAALRAMHARHGLRLVAETSADAGGPRGRTVGYLAAAFPA